MQPAKFHRLHVSTIGALILAMLLPLDSATAGSEQEAHPAQTTIDLLQAEQLDIIDLEKEAYFVAENGNTTLVAPGPYQIEAVEPEAIRLLPRKGKESVTIRATPTQHKDSYSMPVALSVSEPDNRVHVVLLLPGGKALDAAGSFEVIRTRSASPSALSPERLHEALLQKLERTEKGRAEAEISNPPLR